MSFKLLFYYHISKFQTVSSEGTTASFMWELLKDPLVKVGPMKATFSIQYKPVNSNEPYRVYTRPFDIQDYTTLFVIRTKLEPSKGADFCRASQVCCLQLTVQRVSINNYWTTVCVRAYVCTCVRECACRIYHDNLTTRNQTRLKNTKQKSGISLRNYPN